MISLVYNIYTIIRTSLDKHDAMRRDIFLRILITTDYALIDNQTASPEILFVRNLVISRMSHGSVSGPLIVRNFIQFNYLADALKSNEALNRPYWT